MASRRRKRRDSEAGEESSTKRIKTGTEAEDNSGTPSSFIPSPVEKALQNTLILQKIFKFLPYNDLLTCRSVDLPLWSSEAEHAISQRPLLSITMCNYEPKFKMVKTFQGKNIPVEFENFVKISHHLKTFEKGQEIWLTVVLDTPLPDVEKFLKKFSRVICFLSLPFKGQSPPDLQKLLGRLRNLNNLRLADIPNWWKERKNVFPTTRQSANNTPDSAKPFLLPQIKTISLGRINFYPEFIVSLFQTMPNLNNIFEMPLHSIPSLAADDLVKNKLGKIKSIDLSNFSLLYSSFGDRCVNELSQLTDLSQELRLERAHIELPVELENQSEVLCKSCCNSLSSILRNNKSTINYLIIKPCVPDFFQDLEYPEEMIAVKKLRLSGPSPWNINNRDPEIKFFGEKFDPRQIFPNLIEVKLKGDCTLSTFLDYFPEDVLTQNYFKGVTFLHLNMKKFAEVEPLEKAARLFPDVTSLIVHGNVQWHSTRLSHVLRLWPKLTSLGVRVYMTNTKNCRPYPLDSVFTGISTAKCNKLREKKEKMKDIDLQSYRKNFGVPNMTDLKELTLVIGGSNNSPRVKVGKIIPLFSHVAPFYGFQCLPDLKVTCAIPRDDKDSQQIREMLSPMEELIILNPFY